MNGASGQSVAGTSEVIDTNKPVVNKLVVGTNEINQKEDRDIDADVAVASLPKSKLTSEEEKGDKKITHRQFYKYRSFDKCRSLGRLHLLWSGVGYMSSVLYESGYWYLVPLQVAVKYEYYVGPYFGFTVSLGVLDYIYRNYEDFEKISSRTGDAASLGVGLIWSYNYVGSNFKETCNSFGGGVVVNILGSYSFGANIVIVPLKFTRGNFSLDFCCGCVDLLEWIFYGNFKMWLLDATLNGLKLRVGFNVTLTD